MRLKYVFFLMLGFFYQPQLEHSELEKSTLDFCKRRQESCQIFSPSKFKTPSFSYNYARIDSPPTILLAYGSVCDDLSSYTNLLLLSDKRAMRWMRDMRHALSNCNIVVNTQKTCFLRIQCRGYFMITPSVHVPSVNAHLCFKCLQLYLFSYSYGLSMALLRGFCS